MGKYTPPFQFVCPFWRIQLFKETQSLPVKLHLSKIVLQMGQKDHTEFGLLTSHNDKILHIQIVRVDKQIGMEGLVCFGLYPLWAFILNLLLPNFCCRIGIVKILLSIQVKLHRILVPLGLPLGQ